MIMWSVRVECDGGDLDCPAVFELEAFDVSPDKLVERMQANLADRGWSMDGDVPVGQRTRHLCPIHDRPDLEDEVVILHHPALGGVGVELPSDIAEYLDRRGT